MAWRELFGTDVGLLSLFTIVFVIVMGGYLFSYAMRKMNEDGRKHAAELKKR